MSGKGLRRVNTWSHPHSGKPASPNWLVYMFTYWFTVYIYIYVFSQLARTTTDNRPIPIRTKIPFIIFRAHFCADCSVLIFHIVFQPGSSSTTMSRVFCLFGLLLHCSSTMPGHSSHTVGTHSLSLITPFVSSQHLNPNGLQPRLLIPVTGAPGSWLRVQAAGVTGVARWAVQALPMATRGAHANLVGILQWIHGCESP